MNTTNSNITFKGNKLAVQGRELKVGDEMPAFKLTANNLGDLESSKYNGKVLVLLSVPSLDTPVCAEETKRFNKEIDKFAKDVCVLVVSYDLPFAQVRWCGQEGVKVVETASDYKYRGFGENFGTFIPDWGLLSRAVFVIDRAGKVVHVEYVQEVSNHPDYEAAFAVVRQVSQ